MRIRSLFAVDLCNTFHLLCPLQWYTRICVKENIWCRKWVSKNIYLIYKTGTIESRSFILASKYVFFFLQNSISLPEILGFRTLSIVRIYTPSSEPYSNY
jgi:hypothetical protein